MCYYETTEDEKRDTDPLIKAESKFIFVLDEYSNTDFAMDANLDRLIQDILAQKKCI